MKVTAMVIDGLDKIQIIVKSQLLEEAWAKTLTDDDKLQIQLGLNYLEDVAVQHTKGK